jgi:hypothetical protein
VAAWSGGGGLVWGVNMEREMGGCGIRSAAARPWRTWAAVWQGRKNGGLTGGACYSASRGVKGIQTDSIQFKLFQSGLN